MSLRYNRDHCLDNGRQDGAIAPFILYIQSVRSRWVSCSGYALIGFTGKPLKL
ncbi:MAG: hypothetical protein ICV54_27130 [Nostoc sp. C3-bin3]|nr:hypothetical protein [Nostoc sp. C3-bin3]